MVKEIISIALRKLPQSPIGFFSENWKMLCQSFPKHWANIGRNLTLTTDSRDYTWRLYEIMYKFEDI